ncbi:MAG: pyruvate kinase [Hydrogenimonas sp.]|nr:pyruvate kinase [Hydrogenimonas sp.]
MDAKVKIVATLGPSTNSRESISSLIKAGVNIFRLNFSYGTHKEHERTIENIRKESERAGKCVAILQDICGPKIRIRGLGRRVAVKRGDRLYMAKEPGENRFSITHPELIEQMHVGEDLFFADGTVHVKIVKRSKDMLELEVLTPGTLAEGKGVNIPDSEITLSALTEKDKEDLRFGAKAGVDFVAVSFVSHERDVKEARKIVKDEGAEAWIVAKIERKSALERLDEIVEASDAIMVARGDLGAEAGLFRVPLLQKEIIKKCNEKAKPVITATQMLTSMVNSPYPTRAEVSDIANAVLDGTDAVMLSDETAVGSYPKKAVEVLRDTILQTQSSCKPLQGMEPGAREAFPHAAVELSKVVPCEFVTALTLSGYTIRHLSRFRPQKPIYAITTEPSLLRKCAIIWGVVNCIYIEEFESEKELTRKFLKNARLEPSAFLLVTGYLGEKIFQGKSVRYINRCDLDQPLKS